MMLGTQKTLYKNITIVFQFHILSHLIPHATALLQMISIVSQTMFVSSQNSYAEILIPSVMAF